MANGRLRALKTGAPHDFLERGGHEATKERHVIRVPIAKQVNQWRPAGAVGEGGFGSMHK